MVLNIMEIMRNGRIIRTDVFSLKLYLKIMCVCVCVCGGCIACKQNKLKKIVPKPEYQFQCVHMLITINPNIAISKSPFVAQLVKNLPAVQETQV